MFSRSNFGNIRAGVTFFALMLCLYGWHGTAQSAAVILMESKGSLVANRQTTLPPVPKLARQIASTPLSQDIVNAYYVVAVRGEVPLKKAQIAALRRALVELGWRSTAAQQNILTHAVENRDMKTIAVHADALLRRRQLIDEVTELLYLFEANPQSQTELIGRLKLNPEWRTAVLTNWTGMSSPARLAARTQTLDLMFADGLKPTQMEVAPVATQLLVKKQNAESFELWMKFKGFKRSEGLYDSTFDHAFSAHEAEYYVEFPFEWRPRRGPGYGSSFRLDGDDAQVILRWNGRGAPELLDQYFARIEGNPSIRLAGPDLDTVAIKALEFIIDCNGRRTYFDVAVQDKKHELILSAADSTSCDFPRLLILGKPGNGIRPAEVRLSAIKIES